MKPPTKQTLARYGLTEERWRQLAPKDGRCPICDEKKDKWVVDHEHITGWKNMAPERRVLYVRGVICSRCNWRYLVRGISSSVAWRMGDYLRVYERRRP